jgi:uncharacterized protein with HEPN domain
MRDDSIYLRHILECLNAIQEYTVGGRETFFADRKTQKATLRELQELAESTQNLSADLKNHHPEIPWRDIAGFRNVLVHDYLGLNLSRIWQIIERDLTGLKKEVEKTLREFENKKKI